MVPATSPFKNIAELAANAKQHLGQIYFGRVDAISQLPGELPQANLSFHGMVRKAISTVITDLLGRYIQIPFANYLSGATYVAGGKLLRVAISEGKRNAHGPRYSRPGRDLPGIHSDFVRRHLRASR